MLYVFQVDTGTMLTFDMNSAMDTTLALKSRLVEKLSSPSSPHQLSVSSLVLLTGSGSALSNSSPIHLYGTGTDVTNPIFLFNKANIISSSNDQQSSSNFQQQLIDDSSGGVDDESSSSSVFQNKIENLGLCVTSMAPTYQTLAMRSTVARRMYEVDKLVHQGSCRLFQDQNLQLNGWGAVISNLKESTGVFSRKILGFRAEFQGGQENCGGKQGGAQKLAGDIKQLVEERLKSTVDELGRTVMMVGGDGGVDKNKKTLLAWILEQDGSIPSIEKLAENCFRLIDKLDPGIIEGIHQDADKVIHAANHSPCKEIIGLDSRLEGMRDLLERSRILLSKQCDQSTAFVTNESRFADVQDSSVLPDLCLSHQQQMVEMAKNHAELEEIRRRLLKAKEELCSNINHRLKWVIFTQKQISEISIRVNVCLETMRKLGNFDLILRQVFQAGGVYKLCRREVRRRAAFSHAFGEYHSEVRGKLAEATSVESLRREEFLSEYGSHFVVQALFQDLTRGLPPGINVPSPYHEEYNNIPLDDSSEEELEPVQQTYDFVSARMVGVVAELKEELRRAKADHGEEMERIAHAHQEEIGRLRDKHRADLDGLKARIRFFSRTSSGSGGGGGGQDELVLPLGSPVSSSGPTLPGSPISGPSSMVREALENAIRSAPDHVVAAVLSAAGWERHGGGAGATAEVEVCEDVVVEVEDNNMEGGGGVGVPNSCDNFGDDEDSSHAGIVSVDDFDDNVDHDEMRLLSVERGVPLQSSFKKGDRVILYWSKKFDTYVAYTRKDSSSSSASGGGRRKNSSSSSNCSVNFVYNPAELALLQQQQISNNSNNSRDPEESSLPPTINQVLFLATVSNREFCVARRRSATYKVPGGFHFYRLHLQEGSIATVVVKKKL